MNLSNRGNPEGKEEIVYVNGRYKVNPKSGPPPLPTQLPPPRVNRSSHVVTTKEANRLGSSTPDLKPRDVVTRNDKPPSRTKPPDRATLSLYPDLPSLETLLESTDNNFPPIPVDRNSTVRAPRQGNWMKNTFLDGNVTIRAPSSNESKRPNILSADFFSSGSHSTLPHSTELTSPTRDKPSTPITGELPPPREKNFFRTTTEVQNYKLTEEKRGLFSSFSILNSEVKRAGDIEKTEKDYKKQLEVSKLENFDNLSKFSKMVYQSGFDINTRPIIVVLAYLIPFKTADPDKLFLYFIKLLDSLVNQDYVLVYIHSPTVDSLLPKFSWQKKIYSLICKKYKKNLKHVYVVQPNPFIKSTISKLLKPLVSPKFFPKLLYIEEIKDLYKYMNPQQIQLPMDLLPSYTGLKNPNKPEIFGVSLEDTMKHPMNIYAPIPLIVLNCMKYLFKHGPQTEGVFRLSGRKQRMEELKNAYDRGEVFDFSSEQDVHTIAGLLKLYFRSLPDPLCCHNLYKEWMNCYDPNDKDRTKNNLKSLIKKLPHTNYLILNSLMGLLSRILEYSEITKMSAPNLAICWAPNILKQKEESASSVLLETNSVNIIISVMITHFKDFFEVQGIASDEQFSYFQSDIIQNISNSSNPPNISNSSNPPNNSYNSNNNNSNNSSVRAGFLPPLPMDVDDNPMIHEDEIKTSPIYRKGLTREKITKKET